MRHAEATITGLASERLDTPTGYNHDTVNEVSTRAERKSIEGIPGYTISTLGVPRLWGRPLNIDKQELLGVPVILVGDGERFLDEVVAMAFLGPPPAPIRGVTVLHFDGDVFNCRVDNLRWIVDPEWDALRTEHEMQFHMQPANRKRPKQRVVFFK
ncbi:hypothetical protein TUM20984_54050 [Mycobacterium antarcticum]|nr:hypothetical protein TUM20984_54050 [Mycolicibacterium sp. TUM20984]